MKGQINRDLIMLLNRTERTSGGKMKKMNKMSYRNICVFLCFAIAVIFISPFRVQAARERKKGGLEVKEKTGPKIVPNIHMQLGCESCHLGRPKDDEKEAKLLTANGNVVELCKSCHEGSDHHIQDIDSTNFVSVTKIPDILPLGKYGISKGKIVCTTCHLPHVELASNSLLRGFSQGENDVNAKFFNRLDLCASCHGQEFIKKSPHVGDKNMCGFCHSSDPSKAKDVLKETIKRDIVDLCDFCHGSVAGGHFLEVNAFADKSIRKDFPSTLPLIDGLLTCVTCHDPHGKSGNLYLLRADFINFAGKSAMINPHEKRVFCISCHDIKPEPGDSKAGLKFGDEIKMCNWCHKPSEEVAEHHPLGNIVDTASKKTQIPADFPLTAGNITCLTCHERKFECQQGKLGEKISLKNENYLIGGPYPGKNDMCYRCHIKEEFKKINPHEMVKPNGEIIPQQCKFCHNIPPEKIIEGSKQLGLIGNVSFLCLLCHADRDHPGTKKDGTGIKHVVKLETEKQVVIEGKKIEIVQVKSLKPLKDIPLNLLPLDEGGRITCSTCHQAHPKGLIKGERKNIENERMWRMPEDKLCSSCHPF